MYPYIQISKISLIYIHWSIRFQGRVIAALYKNADKKLLSERSGEINVSAEVAKKLKISGTDIWYMFEYMHT